MEGGDWEHSLESGGVERSGGIRFVVCGRGMVTGAELWSSDIVMFGQDHWLLQMFFSWFQFLVLTVGTGWRWVVFTSD